jgi:hypothetical protein
MYSLASGSVASGLLILFPLARVKPTAVLRVDLDESLPEQNKDQKGGGWGAHDCTNESINDISRHLEVHLLLQTRAVNSLSQTLKKVERQNF